MGRNKHTSVEYRLVEQDEWDQSIQLSLYAFQMDLPETQWEPIKKEMNETLLWGGFVGGQLAAQVQVFPLTTYLQGKKFAMGGVANVASWPEHRRGGMVAKLLGLALEHMKEEGQTISFLHPFSVDFYRRYGWETFVDRKKCTIPSHLLPRVRETVLKGLIKRVHVSSPTIRTLYERYAAQFNGMLSRSEVWWETRIFNNRKGELAVYQDADGMEQGYLHYQVKNRELLIHELVTLTQEAKKAIWRFIGQHESSINHVTIHAPMCETIPFELGESSVEQKIIPYFMARIVDVEAFLRMYPFVPAQQRTAIFSGEAPVTLSIQVEDEHAPWNTGVFKLTVAADGCSSVVHSEDADGAADIKLSIQALSTLLMGYMDTQTLYELERVSASSEAAALLAALIPRRSIFLSDFF
jgi:predicted acetyltransferase